MFSVINKTSFEEANSKICCTSTIRCISIPTIEPIGCAVLDLLIIDSSYI